LKPVVTPGAFRTLILRFSADEFFLANDPGEQGRGRIAFTAIQSEIQSTVTQIFEDIAS